MKPVLVLAALLVAALIGLALWLGFSDGPSDPAPSTAARPPRQDPEPPPSSSTGSGKGAAAEVRTAAAGSAAAPRQPRTYAVGDSIVHDRRRDGGPMVSPERDLTPPEGRHISPEVAQRVATAVEPAAQQCLKALPGSPGGDPTKLDVTMTVNVKNGSLTVSDVAAKVAGLEESVLAQTVDCLRRQMVGTAVDAAGQRDLPSYLISTSYTAQ